MTVWPDRPGIIAPPPLLALGAILLGLAVDHFVPLPLWPGGTLRLRLVVAGMLFAVAIGIFVAALGEMRRHHTTPDPYRPSTTVVSSGIYARTRNPIYIGFLIVVLAVAFAFDSAWVAIGLLPLFAALQLGVVRREERYLATKFGGVYEAYRAHVRRWL
jgi:protein-S-isoprenylcysteine O-methyltransferase Ste14